MTCFKAQRRSNLDVLCPVKSCPIPPAPRGRPFRRPHIFLCNSPYCFRTLPTNCVRSTEGASVGGRSSARIWAKGVTFGPKPPDLRDVIGQNCSFCHADDLTVISNAAHPSAPPAHGPGSCAIDNGWRLLKSRTLASKCPGSYHISSMIL